MNIRRMISIIVMIIVFPVCVLAQREVGSGELASVINGSYKNCHSDNECTITLDSTNNVAAVNSASQNAFDQMAEKNGRPALCAESYQKMRQYTAACQSQQCAATPK